MAKNPRDHVDFFFGTPSIADDDPSGFGLQVVSWYGEEAISRPYWIRLALRSKDPELKFEDIVNQPGRLTIDRGGEKSYLHGLVSTFEQGGHKHEWYIYRAVLRPRLWTLTLNHQSRVFQHKSVPEIVREILEQHGVPHNIELRDSYPAKEYVVQYNESDFDFISRLLSHDGIRFAFEHGEKRETVNLFDSRGQDPWVDGTTEVPFHFGAGMTPDVAEWVYELYFREQSVPGKVRIADYNYRSPTSDLATEQEDNDGGVGEVYEYGHHYKDRDEGKRLAQVRQEELAAQRKILAGRSTAAAFRAGHRFTLENHYRSELNEDYLLVRIRHYGYTPITLEAGAGDRQSSDAPSEANYRNEFGAAPARIAFRMPRLALVENFFTDTFFNSTFETTLSSVFNVRFGDVFITNSGNGTERHGKFNGLISAPLAGDSDYAPVDDEGRYQVLMPYDLEKVASRPIRMAQPYSGLGDAGFHFPSHAGNEVVIGYIDGDPDRPIIIGAVPNGDHHSPVTSENSSQHVIRTTSDNRFIIEDKEDHENILLYTPHGKTLLNMGNDSDKEGVMVRTDNHMAHYSGKSGMIHTSGGLILSAWPKDDKGHQSYISAWIPALQTLLKIIIAYASKDPKLKRKVKTFTGQVEEAAKANLSNIYKIDFDALSKLMKDHSNIGTLYKLLGDVNKIEGKIGQFLDGVFQQKEDPGILLTALGDIRLMTKNAVTMTAGKGASLSAKEAIQIASAEEGVGIVGADGLSLFSDKGILSIDAKEKDVTVKSEKAAVLLRAHKNLILDSMEGHVIMRAEGSKSNLIMAGQEAHLGADDEIKITSDKEIILECGQSKIEMKKDGTINITGKDITIDGKSKVESKVGQNILKADNKSILVEIGSLSGIEMNTQKVSMDSMNIDIAAQVKAELSGTMVKVNGKAMTEVKGGLVKVN